MVILLLLLAFLPGTRGSAQVLDPSDDGRPMPGDPDYDASQDRRAGPQEQRESQPDTFGIFQYNASNPNLEKSWRDSLLDGLQRYEPDRKVAFDYGTIGQRGGAAYRLRYEPTLRTGTEIGFRQFDLYQVDGERLNYYRLERPFTYLGHVRESQQEDSWTTAKFSRNFADGVNLLLDYTRISQQGTQDQYPNQNLRNTHVATGLSVRPPGSRYRGFFSFAANTYEQLQNGGIDPASFLTEENPEVQNLQSLTSQLDQTRLRYSFREVMATQYLQFGGRTDTLSGEAKRAFTLQHQLKVDSRNYRVSSEQTVGDTALFFQRFPQLYVDPRGVRNQIQHNIISNDFSLSTFRQGRSGDRETVQKDVLEVGLNHIYHRVRQDGDSTINNLLLHGKIGLRPSDRLNLLVDGQFNVVGQTGDYRVSGTGELDLGKAGKLELKALNQLYAPDLVQQTFRLNGNTLWQNDFNKTLELRLEGAYTLPVVKIRAGLAYSILTNYIYFDELGQPEQATGPNSIIQLTGERDLAFGKFRLQNRVLLQQADQDVFRLPQLYGEHSLYYSGKWFKVLNVNLGVDVRYASGFKPYYYNTITQQFQLQDEQEKGFQYQLDPFFSMRVTRFRFFVKYLQLNSQWDQRNPLILMADHPYPDAAVRMGATWRLLD
ncbi:hypothetical protein A3850_010630 [Lewinella sp. 4G2]|nr:hypothetical protein A3850_010630 [Lewinella sp. 4G2]